MSDRINQDLRGISPFRLNKNPKTVKTLNDINYSSNNRYSDKLNKNRDEILYVSEIQPLFLFKWTKQLTESARLIGATVSTAVNGLKSIGNSLSNFSFNNPFKGANFSNVDSTTNSLIHSSAIINAKMQNTLIASDSKNYNDSILETPISLINAMFDNSKEIGTFELPYDSSVIIKATGDKGWSNTKSEQTEDTIKRIDKFMNLDIPYLPEWKVDSPNNFTSVSLELYLYNDNFNNLSKNFSFIHSFVPGAFWMQVRYLTKSPNIYSIKVLGKFKLIFATMSVTVTEIGTKRKLYDEEHIKKILRGNKIVNKTKEPNFNSSEQNKFKVNKDMKFPDAYKLEITFDSLVPNHFNSYLSGLL